MIAQDFFRVRVLASGSIAAAYVEASMCPHAEKGPARARQRGLLLYETSKIVRTPLKFHDPYVFNKRLGEICGLVIEHDDVARHFPGLERQQGVGDIAEPDPARDHVVQVKPSLQIEVHEPRHVHAEAVRSHR